MLAPQLADAEPQRHDLGRRRRELGLPLEHRQQVVPALGLQIQAIERLRGVEVVRIEIDDRRVGLDGARLVVELAVVDLPEHEEHLLLLVRVRRELGLLGVDVLEIGPAAEADVEPLEVVERHRIGVVDDQHLAIDVDRLLDVLEHLFVELRRLVVEGLLLVGRADDVGLAQQQLHQVRVVAAAQIELLQRVGRVDVARRDVERRRVGHGRLLVVAEVDLAQARDLVIERVLELRVGDRRHQRAVERHQIGELLERAREPLDRALHLGVLRILAQRPSERLVGVLGIVEADLVAVGDLLVERDLLLGVDGVPRLDLVDGDQARPVAARLVDRLEQLRDVQLLFGVGQDPLERRQRLGVLGLDLQDLAVGLDGGARLAELLLAQVAEAAEERDGLVGVLGQLQLALEVVGQLAEVAAAQVQAIERAQRLDVVGVVLEDRLPGLDRLGRVVEHLLPDGRDAHADLLALRGLLDQRELLGERLDQIRPALGARVQPLERHQRRRVLGLDRLRAAEVLDGLLRLLQLLVVGDRDHQQQLALERRRQLLLAAERPLVQRHQRRPVVEDRRQVLQRLARRRRLGVLGERARVGVPRLLGVAQLGLERADAQQQRHALAGVLLVIEPDALDLDQARGVVGLLVDRLEHLDGDHLQLAVAEISLQRGLGAGVIRLERERLFVGRDGACAVAEVLFEQRAAPELELGDPRHIGREIDLLRQRRRQLFPAAEAEVDPIERDQRRQLLGVLREDRLVKDDGLLGLADLVFVQAGELEADLQLLGLRLRELELLVVDRQQVGEAPGRDVESFERADRLGVAGRDLAGSRDCARSPPRGCRARSRRRPPASTAAAGSPWRPCCAPVRAAARPRRPRPAGASRRTRRPTGATSSAPTRPSGSSLNACSAIASAPALSPASPSSRSASRCICAWRSAASVVWCSCTVSTSARRRTSLVFS